MKMRILIIGAKGMVGHMLSIYLKENTNWEVVSWSRKKFEIKNNDLWKSKILKLNKTSHLDYIINCVGILKLASNINPVLAIRINSLFPHELAALATEIKTKVIHFSTDSWHDTDIYGRSKLAGELDYAGHLTLRTSIIGPELKDDGSSLFHWFMNQKGKVSGFINHYWDGITTLELAKFIEGIIETGCKLTGIKDCRARDKVNKMTLLTYLKDVYKKDIIINERKTDIVDKTNDEPDLIFRVSIKEQINELRVWMDNHKDVYDKMGYV